MFGKRFEKELEMIEEALDDDQAKADFKKYMRPLVVSIAEKYITIKQAEGVSIEKIIEAGWTHFDLALKSYFERAKAMVDRENDLFYFSTYFTWYIRQGIAEFLKRKKL